MRIYYDYLNFIDFHRKDKIKILVYKYISYSYNRAPINDPL